MTVPPITLPEAIYREIIAHAQEGAPEEVCGIISGRDNRATGLVRARNEADNPILDYWVDGQTLLKQFEFEDRGEVMLAIYHSHPVSEAYPSATDARNAFYPDSTYLICSLERPDHPVIRAYRLVRTALDQRPQGLEPVRGNARFLAHQQRDGLNDFYYLATLAEDGRAEYQKVRIIEQEVSIA